MDIENLKRAAEINSQLALLREASDKLQSPLSRIWVSMDACCDERFCTCLSGGFINRDFRRFIDEHIEALLEEAKTL